MATFSHKPEGNWCEIYRNQPLKKLHRLSHPGWALKTISSSSNRLGAAASACQDWSPNGDLDQDFFTQKNTCLLHKF